MQKMKKNDEIELGRNITCLCFQKFVKAPTGNLLKRVLFDVRPILVALLYFADSCSKPSWRVSIIMKYLKM